MLAAWQLAAALVIVGFGYPVGARVGTLAADEVVAGKKYLYLFRDVLVLAAVAIACFANDLTVLQYALPAAIILSFFWCWKWAGRIYPWLLAPILLASRATTETFLLNGTLLFLHAFTTGSVEHKSLGRVRGYARFWPYLALSVVAVVVAQFW